MNKMQISASIYAIDYKNEQILQKTIKSIENNLIDYIHLDVCDGVFVKQVSFDKSMAFQVKNLTNVPLDIHLMVAQPNKVFKKYLQANPKFLTVHYEAFDDKQKLKEVLFEIKNNGVKSGLSISPPTSIQQIKKLLEENIKEKFLDMLLVMSVVPGISGQKYIDGSEQKIVDVKKIDNSLIVEVDGGINDGNIQLLKKAGADIVVSGSFLLCNDIKKAKDLLV